MDERQFNYLQEMDIPLWISRGAHQLDEPLAIQPSQNGIAPQVEVAPASNVVEQQPTEAVETSHPPEQELVTSAPQLATNNDSNISSLDWRGLQSMVSDCQCCQELASQRTQTVFGGGNPQTDWLIIGEAPGEEEDRQGEPFLGPAGQLLNGMLQAIGLRRSQVYITNILKCRTPNNRDPHSAEIAACRDYLVRQIELIQPKVILVVGRIAAQTLLNSKEPVGKLRGLVHQFELPSSPDSSSLQLPLVVTYHPAYLLRAPKEKAKAWHDLKLAHNVFNG